MTKHMSGTMRIKNHQRVQHTAAVFLILAALAALPTAFILASYAGVSPMESAACCCGTAEPLCSSNCSVEESGDHSPLIPAQTVDFKNPHVAAAAEHPAALNPPVFRAVYILERPSPDPPSPAPSAYLSRAPPFSV